MRWAVRVRASGWQRSPASSAAVKFTVVETFGVREASCSAYPGQDAVAVVESVEKRNEPR